jgi:hypothetical protein
MALGFAEEGLVLPPGLEGRRLRAMGSGILILVVSSEGDKHSLLRWCGTGPSIFLAR